MRLKDPVALTKIHKLAKFKSEIVQFDNWLQQDARQWQVERGASVTVLPCDDDFVQAFYTLSTGAIELDTKPLRALIIGRMAITKPLQGKGIGEGLVRDAMIRTARISQDIEIDLVLAHVFEGRLQRLYEKFGFVQFQETAPTRTLVKSMKAIRSECWLSGHID